MWILTPKHGAEHLQLARHAELVRKWSLWISAFLNWKNLCSLFGSISLPKLVSTLPEGILCSFDNSGKSSIEQQV